MQSHNPDKYKENPNFLLAIVSHLGVTAVLSNQPSPIINRVERVLQRIYAEVRDGRLSTVGCLEAIGAQLAIVQEKPPTIEELLWAYDASRPLRNREDTDEFDPLGTTQRSLLDECEAINKLVWCLCEERVERARRALIALDQSTIQISNLGGVVNRRALPTGTRVFISYAHEDKRVAHFIESRFRNGGVCTWRDDPSLTGGSVLSDEIVENIRSCSHFCIIESPESKKSRWVSQEARWAPKFEVENESPRIVPILHKEKEPRASLSDRRAVSFDDWASGMSALWSAIGLSQRGYWSLSEVGKLLRRGKRLLAAVEWCGQADGWLTVHEDTFEDLEDSESYLTALGLKPKRYDLMRFARTHEILADNSAQASYSEEFYGFTNSYIAGTVLLEDLANLIEELVGSIEKTSEDQPMLKSQSASS
jgi:hypothetical protein